MLIASLFAALVGSLVALSFFWWTAKEAERWLMLVAFGCTLPASWIMYYGVRLPLDRWLAGWLSGGEIMFWIRTAYAPLTEEPIKLWVLCFPLARRLITPRDVASLAVALGGGFAVGEVFTVAEIVRQQMPEVAALPWYQFGGFLSERVMTVATHAGMTACALQMRQKRYGIMIGLVIAMVLHYFANLPIALSRHGWFGSDMIVNQLVVSLWIMFCFLAGIAILVQLSGGDRAMGGSLYGDAVCPSCGCQYTRSILLGANFGLNLRYEPCPECKRWNWTRRVSAKQNTAKP